MECDDGAHCPYLNHGDIRRLIAERDYLSQRLDEMERLMAVAEAEIEKLRRENEELKEENKSLRHQLKQMLGKIFKPQVKLPHDADRLKRGAPCGHRGNSRRRPEEISEFIGIYPERCDRCGGQLNNYPNIFDEHVIEDIEIKKRVTCYRFHYGYCKRCQKTVRAKANGLGNPNDRIGVQARGVGGYLRYLGLTYRKAARLFKDVFDLNLTHPSFMAFNTEQAQNGAPLYEAIKQQVRHSPYVNADETGWRVDGNNYWLWVFTNKDAALYHIDESRGGKVVSNILGEKYQGVLGCDFYSAYNELDAGAKQRCLGHLLSEIKKVQEKNQFALESIDGIFCHELKAVLKQLIDVRNRHREGAGVSDDLARAKDWAIPKMIDLLSSPIEHEDTQRLRNRIIRHNQELSIFLDDPSVEPTNNRAERQLRPMVIMRKLTFGNRSDSGALNQAVIMSIVETGVLNDVEPLDILLALSVKPVTSFIEFPRIRPP
jgi:FtsZ-binding cell division protein ZapB